MASVVALTAPAPGHADEGSAPFVTDIPDGYRDWQWISSTHEAGNLNSLGPLLGNDVAMKAFRERKLPFPDGTILAALHYRYVHPMKTTKYLAKSNLSFPALPRTFSSWSRTPQSTPQPAAGDSGPSKTANPPTRHL